MGWEVIYGAYSEGGRRFATPVRIQECTGNDCVQRTLQALESSVVRRTSGRTRRRAWRWSMPVVVLFNVVAYSSEKSVKERFVLRSALAHEHRHDDARPSLLGDDASQMLSRLQDAVKAPRLNRRSSAMTDCCS